uniref:Integrase catalytic domain-containing protein n=1 Tax=Tanacetum cinerariifolium TaxID=118510 RepID=A0A699HCL3_TANCI|nr:hypothetical protein [Tanacetum cinerariifolium]
MYCDKNYHQLLPIIAEKVHQEKVQQEKLKAVKARLNFEEHSQHFESGIPSRRRDLGERLGSRHVRSTSGSPEPRLGDKEKSISTYSNDSRRRSYHGSRKDTESCYRSSCSREIEFAFEKHHNKRASSRKTEALSESEDPFTLWIRYFDFPRTRMPSHIKTYDGSEDPEDHLKIFQAVAKTERWAMPTCYDDLKEVFLENYLQQKKSIKDPVEIHNIKQRDGKSTEEFVRSWIEAKLHEGRLPKPTKTGAKSRHIHPPHKNTKRNTGLGQREIQASSANDNPGRKAVTFNQRIKTKQWKRPGEIDEKGGNLMKEKTAGNTNGTTMAEGIQTKDYSNFLSGIGSSSEILFEYCSNRFRLEVKSQMIPAATPLVRFSGEIIWPLGQISMLVKIGDEEHSTSAWMNFMIERSPSPYNEIIERLGAPQKNKAIYEEVEKLVDAGIMKEVHYHSWLSNPVMAKKHDGSWRIATYQRLVDKVFQKQIGQNLEVYMDDLVIKSRSKKEVEAVLSLPSPKCLKDVQRLNGKLASLNRFLSKSAKKSLPFFKTLKKCAKKSNFHWTAEAEMAFKKMKTLIAELPMLIAPKKGELVIYLEAAKEAVSTVLMEERDGKQILIYLIRRTLQVPKINYTPTVKGQILTEFIIERTNDDPPNTPMKDKEELSDPRILFPDGSSCIDGFGADLIIKNPKGTKFTYALRIRFNAINNEAKYEALISGLWIATYVAKEPGMIKYLEKVKNLASTFKEFSIKQVPRGRTKKQMLQGRLQEILPEENKKARVLCRKARRYAVTNGVLYKKSFLGPWLRCVGSLQANYVLREIHEGSYNMHAGPRSVVAKALRSGYYWSTMHADARKLIRECNNYQIEAKPVATITRAQIKKFVWDNIVCRFGLLEEIISDNEKQFRDNPFKDWCEKLCIRQCFAFVKYPQAIGLVERENSSLGEGIKARLDKRSTNWIEEILHVLWAHRTMIKSSNGETPFSLTYRTEAVIPVEISMPTWRTSDVDMIKNDEALEINLDLLEEKGEQGAIQEAKSKAIMEKYYNARVRNTNFKPGDLVYRSNKASHVKDGGKLGPKWEGPYEVTKALGKGAYRLRDRKRPSADMERL